MISSRNNPEILKAAKLFKKKHRDQSESFLIEGKKLFLEALKSDFEIERIFLTEDFHHKNADILEDLDYTLVTEPVLEKLSQLKTPEGIVCIIKKNKIFREGNIVILENINDPSNLGAIIRTADAAGFKRIITTATSADFFNLKTIRSSMGSIFHLSLEQTDHLAKLLEDLKDQEYTVIGTALNGEILRLSHIDVPEKFALVFGNESRGLSQSTKEQCNRLVTLPIRGEAESLNVSVAAGIIMYAYMDQ